MEIFKYTVRCFLSPLWAGLTLQLIGAIIWYRQKSARGVAVMICGTAVMLIGSLPVLTWEARRSMEYVYAPCETELVQSEPVLIVVLGTGLNPDPYLPSNSRVSGSFLARLREAVRVHRDLPNSRLLVSIAGDAADAAKLDFGNQMIELLQLEPESVEFILNAESTADEAIEAKKRFPADTAIVVTSASHMERAMAIFLDMKLNAVAAPADFLFQRKGSPGEKLWPRWVPSPEGIGSNHQWLYEKVAMVWHILRK